MAAPVRAALQLFSVGSLIGVLASTPEKNVARPTTIPTPTPLPPPEEKLLQTVGTTVTTVNTTLTTKDSLKESEGNNSHSPNPFNSNSPNPFPRPTCNDLLGDSLCPLKLTEGTTTVRGAKLVYYVFEPVDQAENHGEPVDQAENHGEAEGLSEVGEPELLGDKNNVKHNSEEKYPIIVINGGPGFSHDYLLPLKGVACSRRRVVMYDQVGTGKSAHPMENGKNAKYLFDPYYYVEELGMLIEALRRKYGGKLSGSNTETQSGSNTKTQENKFVNDNTPSTSPSLSDFSYYHILGHSWGTMVSEMYSAKRPEGLLGVILGGALANPKTYIDAQWDKEAGNMGNANPLIHL
jgi:pimeloyl-ACP methyl ester carboxylesterase